MDLVSHIQSSMHLARYARTILQGLATHARITYHLSRGNLESAVTTALQTRQPQKAIHCYERAGRPLDAARVAEQAGMHLRAIQLYEQANDIEAAGTLATEHNYLHEAIRIYTAAEWFEDAARAALLAEQPAEARQLYERAIARYIYQQEYGAASRIAAEAGMPERARVLEEQRQQTIR